MGEPISKERADLIKSLQAENKKLRDKEPDDDLTIAYLYGYNKGKDFSLAENKRLCEQVEHLEAQVKFFQEDLVAAVAANEIIKLLNVPNDGGTSQ